MSLVSTYRPRQNREVRRFGVSASAAALAVIALGFVAMQGTQRTLLESEGMKEYDLAQAKALLASDEVEVRNSERRLKLIRNKLRGDEGDDGHAEEESQRCRRPSTLKTLRDSHRRNERLGHCQA